MNPWHSVQQDWMVCGLKTVGKPTVLETWLSCPLLFSRAPGPRASGERTVQVTTWPSAELDRMVYGLNTFCKPGFLETCLPVPFSVGGLQVQGHMGSSLSSRLLAELVWKNYGLVVLDKTSILETWLSCALLNCKAYFLKAPGKASVLETQLSSLLNLSVHGFDRRMINNYLTLRWDYAELTG